MEKVLSEENHFWDKDQKNVLRILYSIVGFFYLGIFVFAVYNASKYVFPENRGNRLVKMFYFLAITVCLAHIYYCFYLAINPDHESIIFGDGQQHVRTEIIFEILGTCAMSALNWLVCVTMYQLTLSI